jgi:hypothetical protein
VCFAIRREFDQSHRARAFIGAFAMRALREYNLQEKRERDGHAEDPSHCAT